MSKLVKTGLLRGTMSKLRKPMLLSRKLLSLLMLTPLLGCVSTGSERAVGRFASVPLVQYSAAEQDRVADLIEAACGRPVACPASAVLERWVLDYGRLREMVRATESKKN